MDSNVKREIGDRLRKLRKIKEYSQTELAKEIEKKKNIVILEENEAGKNAISQLEKGKRGLTIDNALIYADIFNVSLDYIYRGTENWKPEYKVIKEQLGLSDETLNKIEYMNKNERENLYLLDSIIKPSNSIPLDDLLEAIKEYVITDSKKDEIILLFNISRLAEKMAEELKKKYEV